MSATQPHASSIAHRVRLRQGASFRLVINIGFLLLSAAFLTPLLLVLSGSLTDESALAQHGYTLWPSKFSAFAYQFILRDPQQIIQAYGVSIIVTVVGAGVSLLIMALLAYPLSRRTFGLRRPLSFYVLFTLLFNGGLVPFYLLVTNYLHLQDSLFALILPYLVVPWFVLLLRTFFAGLPQDLLDAAKVDGAGEWRVFFQVVIPLSRPALATVGLFSALLYWNDWWLALLFINNNQLSPVQYLLYRFLNNVEILATTPQLVGTQLPVASVRMALAVLAIGPILLAFLFVQRYFIRGITVGGLKGD